MIETYDQRMAREAKIRAGLLAGKSQAELARELVTDARDINEAMKDVRYINDWIKSDREYLADSIKEMDEDLARDQRKVFDWEYLRDIPLAKIVVPKDARPLQEEKVAEYLALTAQAMAEHEAAKAGITEKRAEAQAKLDGLLVQRAPKPEGRPKGGQRAVEREAGIEHKQAARAKKIAALPPEAKTAAKTLGLADNQKALLLAAKSADPIQTLKDAAVKPAPMTVAPPVDRYVELIRHWQAADAGVRRRFLEFVGAVPVVVQPPEPAPEPEPSPAASAGAGPRFPLPPGAAIVCGAPGGVCRYGACRGKGLCLAGVSP